MRQSFLPGRHIRPASYIALACRSDSSCISTYLDRDVRRLSAGIDDLKFLGFLRAAAARAGQQVNYKGIADDAEIDQATAKSWLHILETLGIVFLLRPYSNNVLKRTVSAPKL